MVLCCRIVWDKIKSVKNQERWLSTNEEEYEDRDGNVFNKKTYEDLKRQGLLWRCWSGWEWVCTISLGNTSYTLDYTACFNESLVYSLVVMQWLYWCCPGNLCRSLSTGRNNGAYHFLWNQNLHYLEGECLLLSHQNYTILDPHLKSECMSACSWGQG